MYYLENKILTETEGFSNDFLRSKNPYGICLKIFKMVKSKYDYQKDILSRQ